MSRIVALLPLSIVLGACPSEPHDASRSASPDPAPDATPVAVQDRRPQFTAAPEGPVDATVREAMRAAQANDRRLLVYVGAAWCEPCTEFHHAVERGELDEALAGVQLLEFDADRSGPQLVEAGYGGDMIPRFALPGADGKGSGRAIEGGIKGPGAVDHIMQRLTPLLAHAGR
ncbi:MAG: thioredoxin family protein [Nannocystaceae bacterium]